MKSVKNRRAVIFNVLTFSLVAVVLFVLWRWWGDLVCALFQLNPGGVSWGGRLAVLVSLWGAFLALIAKLVVFNRDFKVLLVTIPVLGGVLYASMSQTGLSSSGVYVAILFVVALLLFSWKVRRDADNHIQFAPVHLLLPKFRFLGMFVALILSIGLGIFSQEWVKNYKLTIPDAVFEKVLEGLPMDNVKGEATSKLEEELDQFLRGERAIPQEYRPLVEKGEVPPEYRGLLEEQGVSPELLENMLSNIEIDENGMIKEPLEAGMEGAVFEGMRGVIEAQLNQSIGPYRRYLPYVFSFLSFWPLQIMSFLANLGGFLIFGVSLRVLLWLKIVRFEIETVEARRLDFAD